MLADTPAMTIEEIRKALERGHVAVIRGQIAVLQAKDWIKKAGPDVYRLPGNSGGIPEGVKLPA